MGQTNTQRESPKKNQEQNNQATIIVPDTLERDDDTSENQHFLFQEPNKTYWTE